MSAVFWEEEIVRSGWTREYPSGTLQAGLARRGGGAFLEVLETRVGKLERISEECGWVPSLCF